MNPFVLEQLPANVRLQRMVERVPFARWMGGLQNRCARMLSRCPLVPAEGRVRYLREGGGKSLRFNGRNAQFHALYEPHYRAGYELETCVLLSLLLRGSPTFVDAGSNWGFFALFAAALPAFTGACVCYEPNPQTFKDLCDIVHEANLENRISTRNLGLGASQETMKLESDSPHESGCARLSRSAQGASVPVTTLDAERLTGVSVIKADVEGMELDVLRGAVDTLKLQRPHLVIENVLNERDPAATLAPIRWMQEQNYEIFCPAARLTIGAVTVPLHYGSQAPDDGKSVDWSAMWFFRVTSANRFLLPSQLNLLGCPAEKVASLPGEILS